MSRVILVDDEPNILSSLRRALVAMPVETFGGSLSLETFTNPLMALARAREQPFDLVISDYRMPEMDGVSFLVQLRELQPDIARLILSGYADLGALIEAINRAQIHRFLAKPWDEADLRLAIQQALAHRALLMENARLADLVRVQQGKLTRTALALKRLEQENPGITRVKRAEDGGIELDFEDLAGLDPESL
ncbi:MAG: response regulator [Xanthomonadales bacterium]|nr:hypothetical protein [Xanthomonadales bacterium]MCC6593948.1 response regulator [Xanthomonadales bacterium]MCE7932346.1 response regulator [Xanthomonadales bacterium PRO6]